MREGFEDSQNQFFTCTSVIFFSKKEIIEQKMFRTKFSTRKILLFFYLLGIARLLQNAENGLFSFVRLSKGTTNPFSTDQNKRHPNNTIGLSDMAPEITY